MSKHELTKKDCVAIATEGAMRAGTMTKRADYDWLIDALRERDYYNPPFKVEQFLSHLREHDHTALLAAIAKSFAYELREHRESRARLSQALRYVMPTLEELEVDDERTEENAA